MATEQSFYAAIAMLYGQNSLKTSKNKKKRRHTNLSCFPIELLFAAHAQGPLTIKATENMLSVAAKWANLVEDHAVFIVRYSGSKRSQRE